MDLDRNIINQNREKVANLLKIYGEDTLSYFHLQEDRNYFFSPSGKSFLSFKTLNGVAIVASDPVGEVSEFSTLISSFLAYTRSWKIKPCFISLSSNYLKILQTHGFKTSKIGEEAIINLDTFELQSLKKKVRRAVKHIESLDIEIFFYSPKNLPNFIKLQIEDISNNWLKKNGRKERGFSMTLRRLPNEFDTDCVFAVAVNDAKVEGYLCFVPVYKYSMLSLDHARRKDNAPNGLNEFLIIKSAEYFKSKGIKKISLNFAIFSNILAEKSILLANLNSILERLYKSHTLRTFNEKFAPTWETRYVAFASLRHMPLYLLAILRAER